MLKTMKTPIELTTLIQERGSNNHSSLWLRGWNRVNTLPWLRRLLDGCMKPVHCAQQHRAALCFHAYTLHTIIPQQRVHGHINERQTESALDQCNIPTIDRRHH